MEQVMFSVVFRQWERNCIQKKKTTVVSGIMANEAANIPAFLFLEENKTNSNGQTI
jgi:hypothetical protein